MYTKAGTGILLDSILLGDGSFKCDQERAPTLALTMAYANKGSGDTLGHCVVTESLLSTRTLELFEQFVQSAERDFGELVLGEGYESNEEAESQGGLPKGLGDL